MKREDLQALGIEGETLDKVMDLHGKDIERYKKIEAESENLKAQAKATENSLKDLQEKVKGNEDLTKQIEDIKAARARDQENFKVKITQMKIDSEVDQFLRSKKAKNIKAAKALLDMEKVTYDEKTEKVTGLVEQWDSVYKGNEFLFGNSTDPRSAGNGIKNPEPEAEPNKFQGFRNI